MNNLDTKDKYCMSLILFSVSKLVIMKRRLEVTKGLGEERIGSCCFVSVGFLFWMMKILEIDSSGCCMM